MKQEHIEKIKSYYDRRGDYKINSRYSGEQGTVYTKANDNARWLVIEQKGENGAEVRQTDDTGRITARDTYESIRNTVKCTGISRKKENGRGMIKFSPDETNFIFQFSGEGRRETIEVLKAIVPEITDKLKKKAASSIIHKLSELSEESYSELMDTTRNRKLAERSSSVRKRLADAEKRVKEQRNTERNSMNRSKRRIWHCNFSK